MGFKVNIRREGKGIESLKENYSKSNIKSALSNLAREGLTQLKNGTPIRTGKTAASWDVEFRQEDSKTLVDFTNDNVAPDGIPIVVFIDKGHGTGTGGYVAPKNFIKPIVDTLGDKLTNELGRMGNGK